MNIASIRSPESPTIVHMLESPGEVGWPAAVAWHAPVPSTEIETQVTAYATECFPTATSNSLH